MTEVYLSRLLLDLTQPEVRRNLSDIYQLHRTILSAFPQALAGTSARQHFGVLYRVESIAQTPLQIRLLVQSTSAPDWSRLPATFFAPPLDERGNPSIRRIDNDYTRITAGAQFFFRLRANPTRRLSNRASEREDRLAGKRVALLREEEQLVWLERKGAQHGFRLLKTHLHPEIPAVQVARQGTDRGKRRTMDNRDIMPLTFGATLFTGFLEVTDANRFRTTLIEGIGSGKAFGFGLLSIAGSSNELSGPLP
ncbi:type I-E CRISPR-associated protein Cas6/Cse3/CasE, partial [Roseiflexus sp.]